MKNLFKLTLKPISSDPTINYSHLQHKANACLNFQKLANSTFKDCMSYRKVPIENSNHV